jgi:hypothetical protein
MDAVSNNHGWETNAAKLWLGVAVGVAVGVGIAMSRRKRSRWDQARAIGQRVAERTPDFAEAARDIGVRLKTIYEEGLKVAEDAGELWTRGRKLAGY